MKDPILLATSLSFAIPLTYAAYAQNWIAYSTLLPTLLAGVAFHSSKDSFLMRIDQATIVHLVSMTCKTAYEMDLLYLPLSVIAWSLYVYMYGYYTKSLAFSPSYIQSAAYHGSLHILISGMWVYGIYVKLVSIGDTHAL